MGLERDVRAFSRPSLAAEVATATPRIEMPGGLVAVGVNPYTGTPARYLVEREAHERSAWLQPQPVWMQQAHRWLCPEPLGRWRFAELPVERRTSAGVKVRWLAQRWGRLPVFEGYRGLRFDADGQLEEIFGDHAPMPGEVAAEPAITKDEAFEAAFAHVAVVPLARRSARLVLFYHHPRLRLGWDLELSLARGEDEIQVIVDAAENPGEILYSRSLLANAVHAWVYRTNPGEAERVEIEWPQDWVEADALRGGNARCHFANATSSLRGERDAIDLRFKPAEPLGEEQWVVNAFGWANELHDFFAARGFGEAEGNLQKKKRGEKSRGDDELVVRVFPQTFLRGLASMDTRPDGQRCEMRLGLAGEGCHTALDADVVIHEYAHAVVNRLVGGPDDPVPFRAPQSLGLGEGYCDYFALSLQNQGREVEVFEIGRWIREHTGEPQRGNVYDETFPGHFGLLGTPEYTEPHNVGEIWCVALLRFNAVLGERLGDRRLGHELGWQLVIDSLKLLPVGSAKPSFLEARDALLRALVDRLKTEQRPPLEIETIAAAARRVFARLGMGPRARSSGAALEGVEADFEE